MHTRTHSMCAAPIALGVRCSNPSSNRCNCQPLNTPVGINKIPVVKNSKTMCAWQCGQPCSTSVNRHAGQLPTTTCCMCRPAYRALHCTRGGCMHDNTSTNIFCRQYIFKHVLARLTMQASTAALLLAIINQTYVYMFHMYGSTFKYSTYTSYYYYVYRRS